MLQVAMWREKGGGGEGGYEQDVQIQVNGIIYVLCSTLSDPTLTTHNVMEMVKRVSYSMLQSVLSVSIKKQFEIHTQYQSDDQRSEALIFHTISTHPCLSWNRLASGLLGLGYSEAAAEVTKKYVKGEF